MKIMLMSCLICKNNFGSGVGSGWKMKNSEIWKAPKCHTYMTNLNHHIDIFSLLTLFLCIYISIVENAIWQTALSAFGHHGFVFKVIEGWNLSQICIYSIVNTSSGQTVSTLHTWYLSLVAQSNALLMTLTLLSRSQGGPKCINILNFLTCACNIAKKILWLVIMNDDCLA